MEKYGLIKLFEYSLGAESIKNPTIMVPACETIMGRLGLLSANFARFCWRSSKALRQISSFCLTCPCMLSFKLSMRKKLLPIILALAALSTLSASMYMYPMDHPVYEEMDALYLISGKTTAMGIRPWTDTDIERLLDGVDAESEAARSLKRHIEGYLEEGEGFRVPVEFELTPGLAAHTNKDDFDEAEDWYSTPVQDDTLLDLGLGLLYDEYLAIYGDFSLGFNLAEAEDRRDSPETSDDRYSDAFSTNIPFISDGSISMNFPQRAYFALGNKALRLVVGRDRLSWGSGWMGNLMLGDTLPWHDYISLTFTGSKNFNYQMLFSFFSHSVDYTAESDRSEMQGLRFFNGHRFEWNWLDHELKFVVNESVMYQSENGTFDFRALNPFLILHNFYSAGNYNSLLTLELEWAPASGWLFYLQLAVDDLAVGEKSAPEDGASADGYAAMLGVRNVTPFRDKYFYTGFELVYTSPYMYHRAAGTGESSDYDLYYVSSLRLYASGLSIISRYLSFPFGSDALAGLVRFGYTDPGRFQAEANLMVLAHGIMSKDSSLAWYTGTETVVDTPSTENPFASGNYGELGSGEVEYSLIAGGEGSVNITSWLSLKGALYLNCYWNKDNQASSLKTDLQFSAGLRFHW